MSGNEYEPYITSLIRSTLEYCSSGVAKEENKGKRKWYMVYSITELSHHYRMPISSTVQLLKVMASLQEEFKTKHWLLIDLAQMVNELTQQATKPN